MSCCVFLGTADTLASAISCCVFGAAKSLLLLVVAVVGVRLVSGRGGSYLLVTGRGCCRSNDSMAARRMRSISSASSLLSWHHSSTESLKRSARSMVFRFSCDFALLTLGTHARGLR